MYQVFVGVDVSKDSFTACAIDQGRKKLFEISTSMDRKGFEELSRCLLKFQKDSILVGEESSACYHVNLSAFLAKEGYHTVVINPLLISNFMKLSLRKTKTDKKDAFVIACFLNMFHSSLQESCFLSSDFQELAREREKLSFQVSTLKNDIEKLLAVTFPELLKATNVYSKGILNLLKSYPSAWMIKTLSASEVAKLIKPEGKGRRPDISPEKILSLARDSIACMSPAREFILSQKISQLLLLEEELEKLNCILTDMCQECAVEDLEILKSIKGIGDVTAIHFLAEVGDVSRFDNYKKLIAYAGLDPTVHQSGRYVGQSKISKRGNRHLRRVVWLMAVMVARHNKTFREYYLKKREEGFSYKKAIMSVAHKLIRVIFAMLTHKVYFSPKVNSL
jgi:transposase